MEVNRRTTTGCMLAVGALVFAGLVVGVYSCSDADRILGSAETGNADQLFEDATQPVLEREQAPTSNARLNRPGEAHPVGEAASSGPASDRPMSSSAPMSGGHHHDEQTIELEPGTRVGGGAEPG